MSRKRIILDYSEAQEKVFFDWPTGIKYKTWRKGRRTGATKGAANFCIDICQQPDQSILWGDTVLGNIYKYFDRYFEPVLRKNNVDYNWNSVHKQLNIGTSFVDFRSADQPENWEGFGYKYIFLNEAGIILKDNDLYVKSVLPMLMDYPESKLIAAGVPKGKMKKDGNEHLFYTLSKRASENPGKYMDYVSTPFDNPWIGEDEIKELEKEIFALGGQELVDQEIYGQFINRQTGNTFILHYNPATHLRPMVANPNLPLFLSIDFNLTPFGLIAAHIFEDADGFHFHVVDEFQIENGSIPAMIDAIRSRYEPWLPTITITGDAMGKRGELSQRDNASYYQQIKSGLNLRQSQMQLCANPTHDNSRGDCNYLIYNHPDFKISTLCKVLQFDIENVQIDSFGAIMKANRKDVRQRADMLDCFRYLVNTFMKDWIKLHQKLMK